MGQAIVKTTRHMMGDGPSLFSTSLQLTPPRLPRLFYALWFFLPFHPPPPPPYPPFCMPLAMALYYPYIFLAKLQLEIWDRASMTLFLASKYDDSQLLLLNAKQNERSERFWDINICVCTYILKYIYLHTCRVSEPDPDPRHISVQNVP